MRTSEEILAALQAASGEERSTLVTELQEALSRESNEPLAQLAAKREERSRLVSEFEAIVETAAAESRDFTLAEAEKRGGLTARIDQLDAEITQREDQVRQADQEARSKEVKDAVAQVRRDLGLSDVAAGSTLSGWQVVSEPRTYERGNGHSYLQDLCLARTALGQGLGARSVRAQERLMRHAHENHVIALEIEGKASRSLEEAYFISQMIECRNDRESDRGPISKRALSYRALSTGSGVGGEFTPPMYLTKEWVEYARPGRVLADCQHHEDLPDGTMSINIPKVTSGVSVGSQANQNTNVSNTDLKAEFITFPVTTKAGAQIVSLQLLERSAINFDEIVGRELAKAYAQKLNEAVANGSGEEGDILGILNTVGINTITWTQSEPTLKGYYGQATKCKVDIHNTLYLPATHQVVTPSLWGWVEQTFDTSNRPLVVPSYNGPFNAVQVGPDADVAEGLVGRKMLGLDTFEDASLPQELGTGKNQDVALVGRFDENYLYESPLTTRMLPQTYGAQLSMLIQLYGYTAFTAARYPNANSVITGTGMSSEHRTFNS